MIKTEVLAEGFKFLEGPRWHNGRLWMSDIFGRQVYSVGDDGLVEKVAEVNTKPAGLGFLPDGSLLIVSQEDRRLLKLESGELICHGELGSLVSGEINDMVGDSHGRAYVGNNGFDIFGGEEFKSANVVLVDPNGDTQVVAEEMDFPNGTVISESENLLVIAESYAGRLSAFDIAADGTLLNRRRHLG